MFYLKIIIENYLKFNFKKKYLFCALLAHPFRPLIALASSLIGSAVGEHMAQLFSWVGIRAAYPPRRWRE